MCKGSKRLLLFILRIKKSWEKVKGFLKFIFKIKVYFLKMCVFVILNNKLICWLI